ncbi:MAG: flotillin family protein [Alphaproteobacteria bacterium]|nr:flotillin family protein [Alphaproteobacteria bacterium]MCB9691744.1 flotillin family protein [Alphaproteobacteria bacterium]
MTSILAGAMGVFAGMCVVVLVFIAKQFLFVGKPNELLIFSGQSHKLEDGSTIGYRVVHGGWSWRIPLLEKVDRMPLTTLPIELQIQNAYSKGGIPLAVHAIANVKVSSHKRTRNNAIERFLGRDVSEIRQVAKESLEGHLRGIVAQMTPEEVNEDRLKFAEELVDEAGEDLTKLGLTLDTLKVQSVSDDVQYLDSIGRERLANVLSEAEQAESTAKADAEEAQAQYSREGQVADEQAETSIKERENDLRRVVAELEAQAKSEEERAEQAALAARARAEQELQAIRAKLEHLRLMADVVLPAEAGRQAEEMKSRTEAAQIAADGQALAEVLDLMTQVWIKAGDDAKDIFLIQQLETVLTTVTEKVKALDVGEVTLVDGGDGRAIPGHIAALPATVAAVLAEFRNTTGVDVTGILSRPSSEVSR